MKSRSNAIAITCLLCLAGVAAAAHAQAPAEKSKPATKEAQPAAKADIPAAAYPLATCPISGGKLGSMGDPIIKEYEGREVRFCCNSCPPRFEKNLAASLSKLDEAIIKDQLPLYPLDTSVVSGKTLPEKPVDWVYNNRLVRLADESEKAEFKKEPAKHLAALDAAAIEKQSKDYPLESCPVSKEKLGAMGEAKNIVVAGRLVRLCCNACEKDVRKEPGKFAAVIDEARTAKAVSPSTGDQKKSDHPEPHKPGK